MSPSHLHNFITLFMLITFIRKRYKVSFLHKSFWNEFIPVFNTTLIHVVSILHSGIEQTENKLCSDYKFNSRPCSCGPPAHTHITFKFIWHKRHGRENALIKLSQSILWCECISEFLDQYISTSCFLPKCSTGRLLRFTCIYLTVLWSCGSCFVPSSNCLCFGIIGLPSRCSFGS